MCCAQSNSTALQISLCTEKDSITDLLKNDQLSTFNTEGDPIQTVGQQKL